MKTLFRMAVLISSFFLTENIFAQTQEEIEKLQLDCVNYWNSPELESALLSFGLNKSHFTLMDEDKGRKDICNIDYTDNYPYDERIYIRIYNHYYKNMAKETFDDEKANSESVGGYMIVPDLGDEAFAIRRVEFGRLKSVIIEVVKANVTIQFDINGNASNSSNNRFTPTSVFDFARAIVGPIPTND